jgi:hypothetical protein
MPIRMFTVQDFETLLREAQDAGHQSPSESADTSMNHLPAAIRDVSHEQDGV